MPKCICAACLTFFLNSANEKLRCSSFVDPEPDATIFRELPRLIEYYVPRWEHLNLLEPRVGSAGPPQGDQERFLGPPEKLLASVLAEQERPFLRQRPLEPPREGGAAQALGKTQGDSGELR